MIRHTLMPKSVVLAAAACVLVALAGCGPEKTKPPSSSPRAAAGAPKPAKLVIVKAVYGDLPNGDSIDVTAKVAAMVKDNALRVDASNDLFGDPAEGSFKRLRVVCTIGGARKVKTVGEDETLTLPADEKPLAGKLVIVKAVYGDLAGAEVIDVTDKVAAMVKNNALTVEASNETLADGDDPAEGVHKRLRVDYTIGGVARRKTVGEDRTLTISGKPR